MKKKTLSYFALAAVVGLGISFGGVSKAKAESAVVSPGITLSAGYAGEHFHYGESGDQEHGWLNGFYVGTNYKSQGDIVGLGLGNLDLNLKFTYLGGNVDYDGAQTDLITGESIKLSTNTQEDISDIQFKGGFDQALSNNIAVGEYLSLGYRYWHRSVEGIGGFSEGYNNGYIGLGAKAAYSFNDKISAGISAEANWSPAWSSINYVSSPWGNYNMGSAYNVKIEVPINYNVTPQLSLNLTPYYNYWHFSGSDTKNVVIDGVPVTSYEPSSETNSAGFNIGIAYRF
jgi:hypothetical protein